MKPPDSIFAAAMDSQGQYAVDHAPLFGIAKSRKHPADLAIRLEHFVKY
jgi:hypothetical protein